MGSDCTLRIDEGVINLQGERFLMATSDESDCHCTVGGRIQFGETAKEAITREVFEETAVHMEIDWLGFVHENYFYERGGMYDGRLYYEIFYLFYMKVPENYQPHSNRFDGGSYLEWVSPSRKPFYPQLFATGLSDDRSVRHIVIDER